MSHVSRMLTPWLLSISPFDVASADRPEAQTLGRSRWVRRSEIHMEHGPHSDTSVTAVWGHGMTTGFGQWSPSFSSIGRTHCC